MLASTMEPERRAALEREICRRMVDARNRTGMSQHGLARVIDVSSTQVLRWERGDRLPGVIDLFRYAEGCGTTIEAIVGDLSRRPLAKQMPLGLDLDPPARAVIIKLVDLLRARGHQRPAARRARA